jgi:serine-type D-Ala-D-Ala carboxypeptidase (penicillin-binding protein 5/6)
MTDLGVPEAGGPRRETPAGTQRSRRRRRAGILLLAGGCALLALLAFMTSSAAGPSVTRRGAGTTPTVTARPPNRYGSELAPVADRVQPRFRLHLRSGMLFDVNTGRVLWERQPTRVVAIASLTKMMTALVVIAHARPSARVLITRAAVHFTGSGVGLLPLGKRVSLEPLLYGLLLPSGNDAAIALAQHVAGTQRRFIAMMNARAGDMNLQCTHFTSVSGIVDQGNHSCASDLAVLAHAVLRQPVLAPIVATRNTVLPFPIKSGKLWLSNNNPLLALRYPGADGVKTGFTSVAGPCLVASARRGRRWLAVVLLHSADATDQAERLLDAGFARTRT